jgi:hypothetical protein
MQRKLVSTLFAMIGLLLWADAAPAATLAGTVVAVSGSYTARGYALRPGSAVQVSNTIKATVSTQ